VHHKARRAEDASAEVGQAILAAALADAQGNVKPTDGPTFSPWGGVKERWRRRCLCTDRCGSSGWLTRTRSVPWRPKADAFIWDIGREVDELLRDAQLQLGVAGGVFDASLSLGGDGVTVTQNTPTECPVGVTLFVKRDGDWWRHPRYVEVAVTPGVCRLEAKREGDVEDSEVSAVKLLPWITGLLARYCARTHIVSDPTRGVDVTFNVELMNMSGDNKVTVGRVDAVLPPVPDVCHQALRKFLSGSKGHCPHWGLHKPFFGGELCAPHGTCQQP